MKLYGILLIVFFFIPSGQARNIDWPSAVALWQQNNPELQAAQAAYQATKALENAAKSGFLPEISASISSVQSYNEPSLSSTQNSPQTSAAASLSISQNLFAGFADLNKYRAAIQNTLIAQLQYRQVKAKLSSEFKNAYAEIVYAQEFVVLTQKILERRKENLNIVQLRFASGRENKGSQLLYEAYLQQAVYDSMQARLQLDVAQNTLAQVLGITVLSSNTFTVNQDIPIAEPGETNELDFKKLATNTLEYQQAMAQADAARFTHEQSQSHYYPSLNLTGSLGKIDTDFPPQKDRWSIGLNLTLPLYSGGRDSANEQASKYRRLAAEINQNAVVFQVLVKLKQAYSQYKLAVEKVKVDEKFKLAAQMRSEIAKKKYNNGLMTFENWDLVENDLIQREKNHLTSFRERIAGQAKWEQAQGLGLLP